VDPKDKEIFLKLQSSYASCMDVQALEQLGLKPLEALIQDIKSLFKADSPASTENIAQSPIVPHSELLDPLPATFVHLLRSGVKTLLDLDVTVCS
jgi:hypothetical protein